jgi:hypothetical protein
MSTVESTPTPPPPLAGLPREVKCPHDVVTAEAPKVIADGTTNGQAARLLWLLAMDALPLVGVLLFHWQVFPIILLFWAENVVAGGFTVAKMAKARGSGPPSAGWSGVRLNDTRISDLAGRSRGALIGTFIANYGIFTAAHGFFIVVLFSGLLVPVPHGAGSAGTPGLVWFGLAFGSLIAVYAADFWRTYLGRGEYLQTSPVQAMTEPYGRMIIMHLAIVFGGLFVDSIGAPMGGLLLLVVFKTGYDIAGWRQRERRRRGRALVIKPDEVSLLDERRPETPLF